SRKILIATRTIAGECGVNERDPTNLRGLIDTEHVLHGLFKIAPAVSKYLISAPLNAENPAFMRTLIHAPEQAGSAIFEEVNRMLRRSHIPIPESAEILFSAVFIKCMQIAYNEACKENVLVGPQYILLGLVAESNGAAAKFLTSLYCANPQDIRDTI